VYKRILIVCVLFLLPVVGVSQNMPAPGPPPPPPGLPLDEVFMTSILLLSGLIYGSKKIFKDSSS